MNKKDLFISKKMDEDLDIPVLKLPQNVLDELCKVLNGFGEPWRRVANYLSFGDDGSIGKIESGNNFALNMLKHWQEKEGEVVTTAYEFFNILEDIGYKDLVLQTKRNMLKGLGFNTSPSACVICENEQKQILFTPCMHVCSCEKCSPRLVICPVCQGNIEEKKRVYIV
jgi:hypothetical protein